MIMKQTPPKTKTAASSFDADVHRSSVVRQRIRKNHTTWCRPVVCPFLISCHHGFTKWWRCRPADHQESPGCECAWTADYGSNLGHWQFCHACRVYKRYLLCCSKYVVIESYYWHNKWKFSWRLKQLHSSHTGIPDGIKNPKQETWRS